ncbi:MAG: histidine kinase [Bacteroidetes bacterium]|nr:histidine kinase [Bacteroidota bacterium]
MAKFYTGKNKILTQVLFWGIAWLLLPLLSSNSDFFEYSLARGVVIVLGVMLIILANLNWLLPRLFFQKKYLAYALIGIVLIIAVTMLADFIRDNLLVQLLPEMEGRSGRRRSHSRSWIAMRYLSIAMPYIVSFIGSALFEIAVFAKKQQEEAVRLRNEKLEAEMKFLKSQINPHFLFNSLNNIYALSVIQSPGTSDNILKLSDMLRYMLYECNADKVPLKKELEYIHNYIDLKMLKDSRGLNVEVDLDDSRPGLMISPMLFIPFIENAFKHSKIEDIENGWIKINLKTADDHIFFEVRNSIPSKGFTKDKVGGIGLENVERQLELLYPGKHDLKINPEADEFVVTLNVQLR